MACVLPVACCALDVVHCVLCVVVRSLLVLYLYCVKSGYIVRRVEEWKSARVEEWRVDIV